MGVQLPAQEREPPLPHPPTRTSSHAPTSTPSTSRPSPAAARCWTPPRRGYSSSATLALPGSGPRGAGSWCGCPPSEGEEITLLYSAPPASPLLPSCSSYGHPCHICWPALCSVLCAQNTWQGPEAVESTPSLQGPPRRAHLPASPGCWHALVSRPPFNARLPCWAQDPRLHVT